MIVTIDGPAGAGKSSTALRLAERLGFAILDTGAMYRAVALAGLRAQCSLDDEASLAFLLSSIHIAMPAGQVLLNEEDVAPLLRSPEITKASMPIAASRAVREKLVGWQREIAAGRDIVTEGRDSSGLTRPTGLSCQGRAPADCAAPPAGLRLLLSSSNAATATTKKTPRPANTGNSGAST